MDPIVKLEQQLDDFNPDVRAEALESLCEMLSTGKVETSPTGFAHNMHFHTFFSYNACGYSPSKIAWLSKRAGLAAAGIVDFDVLDGLEEFLKACRMLNLKGAVGIETRVFVPEFADKEISSPGEPGIAYHMGIAMPSAKLTGPAETFLKNLGKTSADRNLALIERVNEYLDPVKLDYEKDVLPLAPSGNATERHVCLAYAQKAAATFTDPQKLKEYWVGKLSDAANDVEYPTGGDLQGLIRKKTMKKGGIGYVQPDSGSFPELADMNSFVIEAGGIPTHTWLNGMSEGEQEVERLLEIGISTGVAAANVIPDRNYTPGLGTDDEKCKKLYEFVGIARKMDLPIIAGTEMNSPGLKFVDDFSSRELKPLTQDFLKGANIAWAHTAMQSKHEMGLTSHWANETFDSRAEKNSFYLAIGAKLEPSGLECLDQINPDMTPQQILKILT